MTLRDRGTKKWTSIFLPEHVARLRRIKSEMNRAHDQNPSIDPEQWAEFESKIQFAYKAGIDCEIRYKPRPSHARPLDHFTILDV
ncbi:hypothetical protein HOO54_17860 [Bacillus sp. WMMC1349]|uniref:YolD-like family protein n=1 Tax=Bacillus sp. WMMC1349 TaxID=2736254 RepID=UPI0015526F7B|nr:YolD-like family protein [Bacillus sp. WMMC1349]NPC94032.1 hypothetical protein [Bacillus sp. WMMC1349]